MDGRMLKAAAAFATLLTTGSVSRGTYEVASMEIGVRESPHDRVILSDEAFCGKVRRKSCCHDRQDFVSSALLASAQSSLAPNVPTFFMVWFFVLYATEVS